MGDSDHHNSFDLEEASDDVARFVDDNKLSIVTVGGHGYGAKVASAFGSYYMEKTSGVICFEGGPLDHSYHEAWEEIKNAIIDLSKIDMQNISQGEVNRRIDQAIEVIKYNLSILNGDLY
jgi:pimeloyl-ACP methyl ester carboxylesterase